MLADIAPQLNGTELLVVVLIGFAMLALGIYNVRKARHDPEADERWGMPRGLLNMQGIFALAWAGLTFVIVVAILVSRW